MQRSRNDQASRRIDQIVKSAGTFLREVNLCTVTPINGRFHFYRAREKMVNLVSHQVSNITRETHVLDAIE